MVEFTQDFFLNNFAEQFHVYHIARYGVYFARYPHYQFVIVPMIVGIVALSEYSLVFRITNV